MLNKKRLCRPSSAERSSLGYDMRSLVDLLCVSRLCVFASFTRVCEFGLSNANKYKIKGPQDPYRKAILAKKTSDVKIVCAFGDGLSNIRRQ